MKAFLKSRSVNFKFREYINNGFEFLKKDFRNIFLAHLLCFIMSIIPFCGLLAIGNLYKYLWKLRQKQDTSPGEIFNFRDFKPFFILQLIIFAGTLLLYLLIPIVSLGLSGILLESNEAGPNRIFIILYYFLWVVAIGYFVLKGFYIIPLISLKGIKEIKEAWNVSKVMTKGNLLSLFLFTLVVSLLSQIGIIAFGIGIFLTLPFIYTARYFAYEDAIQQIEYNETTEIGSKNKF